MATCMSLGGAGCVMTTIDRHEGGETVTEPMAYMGRKPCDCVVALTVDLPELKKDVAKEIGKWIRDGLTVERVSLEVARESFVICPHKKAKAVEMLRVP